MADKKHHPQKPAPVQDPDATLIREAMERPRRHTPRGKGESWNFRDVITDAFSPGSREMIEKIKDGRLAKLGEDGAHPEDIKVIANVRAMAKRMGMKEDPIIFVDVKDASPMPSAIAAELSGRKAIIVNDSALSVWSEKQLEGVLGHETSHLANNDDSMLNQFRQNIVGTSNKPLETRADMEGTGPKGTSDPKSLAEALKIGLEINYREYQKRYPRKSKEEFLRELGHSDQDHPLVLDRIKALTDAATPHKDQPIKPLHTPGQDITRAKRREQ